MKKAEIGSDNNKSWLEQIEAQYKVAHEDFTTHYPDGIIVYIGSSKPPAVVFQDGFKRSLDPIWIENSGYLLRDEEYVRHYVSEQVNLNRTTIQDPVHGNILFPGATTGLISTTFSPKKAAWQVSQSFLADTNADALNHYCEISNSYIQSYMRVNYIDEKLNNTVSSNQPIGYIYAVRITQGINISAHFQWADVPDPNILEQVIACLEIPSVDVVYARPVFLKSAPDHRFVCTQGDLIQNNNISALLHPLVSLISDNDDNAYLDIGFNDQLKIFKGAQNAGMLCIDTGTGKYLFSHHPDEPLSLDDGNFSRFFIEPHIAPTQSDYLARLKARLDGLASESPQIKRSKTEIGSTSLSFPGDFTDRMDFDDDVEDPFSSKGGCNNF